MIAFLEGEIVEIGQGYVVVGVSGGVGYKVKILEDSELWKSMEKGVKVKLYTSQFFRENDQGLFGFQTSQERNFFELLTTVSGVGPKLAATILSHIKVESIAQMILDEDVAGIVKVPGIGKKMAERLIIDLRDKVFGVDQIGSSKKQIREQQQTDIEFLSQALTKLGFSKHEINKMLKDVDNLLVEGRDLEDVLGIMLKG